MKDHIRLIKNQEGPLRSYQARYKAMVRSKNQNQELLDQKFSSKERDVSYEDDSLFIEQMGWSRYRKGAEQKDQRNFEKMDQLIKTLGYLDYRDILAANKYIIESRK